MKNKGISLIVLVITILVLGILATTVIISLNNTNIIEQASNTVRDNNLQTMKEAVNLQVVSHMATNKGKLVPADLVDELNAQFASKGFAATESNGTITMVDTAGTMTIEVSGTGMVTAISGNDPYANLEIGDIVEYTPTPGNYTVKASVNADESSNHNSVKGAQTFSTTAAELADLEWVYIGRDETTGKHLITTKNPVNKEVGLYGRGALAIESNGKEAAINELNNLCEALYSSGNQKARSMTVEDAYRILEYTGDKGVYMNLEYRQVYTPEPKTFAEIWETLDLGYVDFYAAPSTKPMGEYLSVIAYINVDNDKITSDANKKGIVFLQDGYWLSSLKVSFAPEAGDVSFGLGKCFEGNLGRSDFLDASPFSGQSSYRGSAMFVRPVVSL